MMKEVRIKGRGMVEGKAEGEALVSRTPLTFAHGVDPKTGVVTDPRSDIQGMSVKDRVLVFPFGKGSTTGASWFVETVRNGSSPVAIVNYRTEPIIVAGSVLAKLLYGRDIPVISEFEINPADVIMTGDFVLVDASGGYIVARRKNR